MVPTVMKALVLCVDRDNDIGVKADLQGPIIGRKANLEAAMKLGIVDPEDADVNTILTAISMYDELVKGGLQAEVATIAGDPKVGHQSDRLLAAQLDQVLDRVNPDYAYLVSDGAEDESFFPIIASRVKVNHVKRVYVKQSPSVESVFVLLAKAMKDPRWRRVLVLPFALSFVALALVLLLQPQWALPAVLLVLGFYLLGRAYEEVLSPRGVWRRLSGAYGDLKGSLMSGRISLWFDLVAAITFLVALFVGFRAAFPAWSAPYDDFITQTATVAVIFLIESFWIFILAFLLHEGGRVAEAYFTKGQIARSFFYVALAFVVLMLVVGAGLQLLSTILLPTEPQSTLLLIYIQAVLAISIVLVAASLHRSEQREAVSEDAWRP
jgi:putative membrane protein